MFQLFISMMFMQAQVRGTSIKMDFLSAGTVRCYEVTRPQASLHSLVCRTDPLEFSQTGACLSDHVHRFYGAVSNKTMRPEVR